MKIINLDDIGMQFDLVCRFCLSDSCCVPLFLSDGCFNERLQKSFEIIASKVDEDDGLPNNICSVCVQRIEDFVDFEANCIKSYEILEKLAQQSQQAIDSEEVYDEATETTTKSSIADIEVLKDNDGFEYMDEYDENLSEANQDAGSLLMLDDSLTQDATRSELNIEYLSVKATGARVPEDGKESKPDKGSDETDGEDNGFEESPVESNTEDLLSEAANVTALSHIIRNNRRVPVVECMFCKKSYRGRNNLRKHLKIHFQIKDYCCGVCQKTFSDRTSLRFHELRHAEVKSFECDQCDRSFYSKIELNQHFTMKHGKRDFVCTVCTKRFPSKMILNDHLLVHRADRPFVCGTCGKGFKRNRNLTRHVVTHAKYNDAETSEDAKTISCEYCDCKLEIPSHLLLHLQQLHPDEYDNSRLGLHRCPKCLSKFDSLDECLEHQDRHYIMEVKSNDCTAYQCGHCGKQLRYRSMAEKHLQTHSSERSFRCMVKNCFKRYKFKAHLTRHQRFAHAEF